MFCKLATRLPAYQGVMREHALREQRRNEDSAEPGAAPAVSTDPAPAAGGPRLTPSGQAPPPLTGGPGSFQQGGKTVVQGSRQAIQADPELSKLISFG